MFQLLKVQVVVNLPVQARIVGEPHLHPGIGVIPEREGKPEPECLPGANQWGLASLPWIAERRAASQFGHHGRFPVVALDGVRLDPANDVPDRPT